MPIKDLEKTLFRLEQDGFIYEKKLEVAAPSRNGLPIVSSHYFPVLPNCILSFHLQTPHVPGPV